MSAFKAIVVEFYHRRTKKLRDFRDAQRKKMSSLLVRLADMSSPYVKMCKRKWYVWKYIPKLRWSYSAGVDDLLLTSMIAERYPTLENRKILYEAIMKSHAVSSWYKLNYWFWNRKVYRMAQHYAAYKELGLGECVATAAMMEHLHEF